jgi:hypothetical protein
MRKAKCVSCYVVKQSRATVTKQRAHEEICDVNEPQLLSALLYVTEYVLHCYISVWTRPDWSQ